MEEIYESPDEPIVEVKKLSSERQQQVITSEFIDHTNLHADNAFEVILS